MKAARAFRLPALIVCLCAAALAENGEPKPPESVAPEVEITREVVKRYIDLDARAVWQAADADDRADVRFADFFKGLPSGAGRRETLTVGRSRYPIALRFMTQTELCCLVDARRQDMIRKVRGMAEGQEITVEGMIVGRRGALKCVLADRVLTGNEKKSRIEHELVVRWPNTKEKPKLIVKPGTYKIAFPSRYKPDADEEFTIAVKRHKRDELLAQMAKEAAQRERDEAKDSPTKGTKPPRKKVYGKFQPEAAYRLAGGARPTHLEFQDTYRGRTPATRDVRQLQLPGGRRLPVGYVFDTAAGISCIIHARDRHLLALVDRLVRGQKVTVRGTALGRMSALNAVLVDEIDLPAVAGVREIPPFLWLVTLKWGDEPPKRLYEIGTYRISLPSRHAEERKERIELELREVRLVPHLKKPEKPGTVAPGAEAP